MTGNGTPPPVMSPNFDLYRQGYRDGYADALTHSQPSPLTPPSPLPFAPHPEWIPLRHIGNGGNSKAPPPCGGISHYLTQKVTQGEQADIAKLRLADGTAPKVEDKPVCWVCHEPINPWSRDFLDYSHAFSMDPPPELMPPPNQPAPEIKALTNTLVQIEEELLGTSVPPPHRRICGICSESEHPGRPCHAATFQTP
jgi:hypothetical protein